jgi:hypothetical protein
LLSTDSLYPIGHLVQYFGATSRIRTDTGWLEAKHAAVKHHGRIFNLSTHPINTPIGQIGYRGVAQNRYIEMAQGVGIEPTLTS